MKKIIFYHGGHGEKGFQGPSEKIKELNLTPFLSSGRNVMEVEKIWELFQKHMGYTDEQMEVFRSDPVKVQMVTETPDFVRCKVVVEVVESENCHAGHKVGDKFVMTAGGVLIGEECPNRMCMFALGPVANILPGIYERLLSKSDPDCKRSDVVQCSDVGLDKGGWGKVLMKVSIEKPD
jgi:uncharacterized repeat protein (TIGR04076 family)